MWKNVTIVKMLSAVYLFCLVFLYPPSSGYQEKEWVVTQLSDSRSGLEGVTLTLREGKREESAPILTVLWNNQTRETLCYGDSYSLEKKTDGYWREYPPPQNVGNHATGRLIRPSTQQQHTYPLGFYLFPLSEGEYRLRTGFTTGDQKDLMEYEITLEFSCRLVPVQSGAPAAGSTPGTE